MRGRMGVPRWRLAAGLGTLPGKANCHEPDLVRIFRAPQELPISGDWPLDTQYCQVLLFPGIGLCQAPCGAMRASACLGPQLPGL